jgi:hypothetical protein
VAADPPPFRGADDVPWEKLYFVLSAGGVHDIQTPRVEELDIGATGGRGGGPGR